MSSLEIWLFDESPCGVFGEHDFFDPKPEQHHKRLIFNDNEKHTCSLQLP